MELLQTPITIVLFFLILGALVVVHELGHFVTARLANVRVLEFGIGFPPRAKVLRAKGETLYTLNWLPIGGFVKLEGEDGDDTDDPRSFANAQLPTRLVILVAGVADEPAPAFADLLRHRLAGDARRSGSRSPVVEPGSPAATAGLAARRRDRRDQRPARTSSSTVDRARPRGPRAIAGAGQTVTLGVERAGRHGRGRRRSPLPTRPARSTPGKGALGIRPSADQVVRAFLDGDYAGRPLDALSASGADETIRWFGLILGGLGDARAVVRHRPDRAAAGRGPGRHRDPDRRRVLGRRARS